MADCMPPLLLEACVVLGASEDKLARVHQVSAQQDDLKIVTFTVQQETGNMAVSVDPHRRGLFSALSGSTKRSLAHATCMSVNFLRQINVLQSSGTNWIFCSDCRRKQMWT